MKVYSLVLFSLVTLSTTGITNAMGHGKHNNVVTISPYKIEENIKNNKWPEVLEALREANNEEKTHILQLIAPHIMLISLHVAMTDIITLTHLFSTLEDEASKKAFDYLCNVIAEKFNWPLTYIKSSMKPSLMDRLHSWWVKPPVAISVGFVFLAGLTTLYLKRR